jgi:hypothetical protein
MITPKTMGPEPPAPAIRHRMKSLVDLKSAQHHLVFYVSLVCSILTIVIYYPGYMSADSVEQLRQARFGVTNNIYPPLMAYIWSVTDKIIPGPGGMLILHNLVFWFALALIAYVVVKQWWLQSVWVIAAGFWPPTFATIGTIWKDVGMQVFLLAAIAAVLYAGYARRLWPLAVAMLCIFIGSGYRLNGVAGALPLTALVVIEFATFVPTHLPKFHAFLMRQRLKPAFYAVSTLGGTWIILSAVTFVQNYHLTNLHFEASVMLADLAGISVEQGRNLLPPYITGDVTAADLQGMYTPLHGNSLGDPTVRTLLGIQHPSPKALGYRPLTEEQVRDIRERWVKAVFDNLGSYLHNRGLVAARLLVINGYPPWYPYIIGIDPNPFGLKFKQSFLNVRVMDLLHKAAFASPLFHAWIYYEIVGLCFVISFFWDFAYARAVQVLAVSTFLYLLSLFMAAASGDFRYNIWALTCCYLCPILLLAGRTRKVR